MMLGVRRATVTEAASSAAARGAHPVPPRRGGDRGPARAGGRDVRVLPDRAGGVRPPAGGTRRVSAATATVLVVDDESMVRTLVRRMLEPGGVRRRRGRGRRIGAPAHRARPAGDRRGADRPGDAGHRRVRPRARCWPTTARTCPSSACRASPRSRRTPADGALRAEAVLARDAARGDRAGARAEPRARAGRPREAGGGRAEERGAANGSGGRPAAPAPTPSTWWPRRWSCGGSARSRRRRVRFSRSRAWRNWQTRRT